MEGLGGIGMGLGRAIVETGELEIGAEDCGGGGEQGGVGDDAVEDFAFVDQVGEALGVGFLPKFGSGVFTFDRHAFGDGGAKLFEPSGVDHSGDDRVPLLLQLLKIFRVHAAIVTQ